MTAIEDLLEMYLKTHPSKRKKIEEIKEKEVSKIRT